jgi:hypothetical protein
MDFDILYVIKHRMYRNNESKQQIYTSSTPPTMRVSNKSDLIRRFGENYRKCNRLVMIEEDLKE